jgi:cytochrome c5
MLRKTALTILAAFVTALSFAGCGGKKDVANAAETVGEGPASTAAPYEADVYTVGEEPASSAAVYEAETAPASEINGETLLETRCTVCHTLDRVKKKKLDRAGWEKIVVRMKGHGAKVNDDEREALVGYLAAAYGK